MNNFFVFLILIWNVFKIILKILFGKKKNIFFIDGGFGIISLHSHFISNLNNKNNLLVWLIKEEFNPIEMINFWRQKVNIITLKLSTSRKKTFLKYFKKIILFFGKKYFDIFDMEKKFLLKKKIAYEQLEIENKNLVGKNYEFHNNENLKKNIIFRTPLLLLIKEVENSNIPNFDKNKIKIKKKNYDFDNKKIVFIYIRYKKPSSTSPEGASRNGSNLKDFEKSIKYLNNLGYIIFLNGDFDISHLDYLKKRNCKIYFYKDLNLNITDFYIYSALNCSFGICEYGGGIPFLSILKKKLLLINFFPISHGYPNSLIHPKICINKNYKNIDELFTRNSFIDIDFKSEFRTLSQNEIYDVVFEFYNDFLFKNKIHKNEITKMKCNFSNYFKTSKYSETYLKIQKGLFYKG